MDDQSWALWVVIAPFPILVALYLFALVYRCLRLAFSPWMAARRGGAPISLWRIINMQVRSIDAMAVVNAWIACRRHDVRVSLFRLEFAYEEGIDLEQVIAAMDVAAAENRPIRLERILKERSVESGESRAESGEQRAEN